MLTGIILIVAGLLIALYPPLSLIVAGVLTLFGVLVLMSAHYHHKLQRQGDNPITELILPY